MHRVLLVNTTRGSTRDQITEEDKPVGEAFFSDLGLQYAGHSIVEGSLKMAATWLVPDNQVGEVARLINLNPIEGYEALMKVTIRYNSAEFSSIQFM